MVQYVCYFPRDHIKNTTYTQRKRENYFHEKITTSHWPAPVKAVPLQPNYFEINYETLHSINLNDLMDEIETLI